MRAPPGIARGAARCLTRCCLTTLLAASLASCAAGTKGGDAGPAAGPSGRPSLRREDRVLLTKFSEITGVAVSQRMVFITTPTGLGIYDKLAGSWYPPLTAIEGFPRSRVTAVAADPAFDAVWVGGMGELLYYRPFGDQAVHVIVPGIVEQILFDRRDLGGDAFVRASGQWSRVSRGGFVGGVAPGQLPPAGERITAPTLAQIYAEYPALRTFEPLLTRDGQLRSWPVSAGGKAPDRTEVWLGTFGNGLFQVDPYFNRSTHYPFGLLEEGAGALALAADGVWVAGLGDASSMRGGLTFASEDLERWRWLEGDMSRALVGARALALAVRGTAAWIATDRGLARLNIRDETDVRTWSALDGLPSDVALAVVARDDGAWVGTARGLVFVTDSGGRRRATRGSIGETLVAGVPVRELLLTGDTLWIGSDAGLLLLPPGDTLPVRAAAASEEPRLRRSIRALARSDSLVVVADSAEVMPFDLRAGQLPPRLTSVDFRILGGISALALDGRTLWAGGRNGLLVVDRASMVSRFLPAPAEVAGEVRDIVLDRDFAWIATRAGVLRLRRLPDGTIP